MGQEEIIDFLRSRRLAGDHSFFSVQEIKKGLNGGSLHPGAIRRCLYSLVRRKVLESRAEGDLFDWYRSFRILEEYVKE